MYPGLPFTPTETPRAKMVWALLGALIIGQLAALWLVCSHQVRQAEARQTEITVQQMALADCLRYIPGASIATCSSRIGGDGILPRGEGMPTTAAMGAGTAPVRSAMPVSFSR